MSRAAASDLPERRPVSVTADRVLVAVPDDAERKSEDIHAIASTRQDGSTGLDR